MSYLDYNATTPVDERVVEAMLPYLRGHYGNPSSLHRQGRLARAAVEKAREQVAGLINAHPSQVIFTSGGTEANNLAIKGVCSGAPTAPLLVGATEHSSVLGPATSLAQGGWPVRWIPVDALGRVTPAAVADACRGGARLVSVMAANNETGVVHDVAGIAAAARAAGAIFHTDAVQAVGKVAVDFAAGGAQLMSLSAHKLYGPKGVGALIADRAIPIDPQLHGSGHEGGLRSGTENVAGIVGFGAAAALAQAAWRDHAAVMLDLRRYLEGRLHEVPGTLIFSEGAERLPNTVFFSLAGVDGEALKILLDRAGIAVSSGSACTSGSGKPSHVLLAMGVEESLAYGAVRVSLGPETRRADVDMLIEALRRQAGGGDTAVLGWG